MSGATRHSFARDANRQGNRQKQRHQLNDIHKLDKRTRLTDKGQYPKG